MDYYCQDRDLLSIEPIVFIAGGFPSQQLINGTDGSISGTTFTSAGSNFSTAGIKAGMALCSYDTTPSEGNAFEITSIDSATQLTISVLRGSSEDSPTPPPAGSNLSFYIRTFEPQIKMTSSTLGEKLRQMSELAGIDNADFADSEQLRITTAYGTLSSIFTARAENAAAHDANWIKAEHYRNEYRKLQLQLRLAVDEDGDGLAEKTRTLGNVILRRV